MNPLENCQLDSNMLEIRDKTDKNDWFSVAETRDKFFITGSTGLFIIHHLSFVFIEYQQEEEAIQLHANKAQQ